MKKILTFFILILFNSFVFSQEVITDLYVNPQIINKKKSLDYKKNLKQTSSVILPFLDDFSFDNIFPDTCLWIDNYAFINTDYPVYPVSIGVATLDAINDTGALYPNAETSPFLADYLTSKPIRMDSVFGGSPGPISIDDSVYFSFFYQPGGGIGYPWERVGNAPEPEDSLILEFYSYNDSTWNEIWKTKGITLDTIYDKYNTYFKQVMIPVLDSIYFNNNFQFRFKNYASISNSTEASWAANCDQWHIDYVYLNISRSKDDTIYKDITFIKKAPSVLKNYQSMPWSQFNIDPNGEMKNSFSLLISNLDTITYNSYYKYEVFDETEALLHTYDGGSYNIYPFIDSSYQNYAPHANPPVDFTLPLLSDSAYFEIKHIIREGMTGDNLRQNDTIHFIQKFYNYYAYDDGTPENGYGLSMSEAKLAYRFILNHPDTLRAIQIFFNQTYNSANQQYFYLTVWNDNQGKPGDVIYEKAGTRPVFENELNKLYTYKIEDTTLIITGTFYIGMEQTTDDNLNIGFDRNTNSQDNILYNVDGSWTNTMFTGSLMIRPVLGKELPQTGIDKTEKNILKCKIYPNPLNNGILNIKIENNYSEEMSKSFFINIYNAMGELVYSSPYKKVINISDFENGIYLIRILDNKNSKFYTDKLIISK